LALVLEFAGHQCSATDSLPQASKLIQQEKYEMVLADSSLETGDASQLVRKLKSLSPGTKVMILSDDAGPTRDEEAITNPYSPVQNLATALSTVERKDAFLVLLPEPSSLRRLTGLPGTVGMLNRLAVLYHSQRKYNTAEQLYKRALTVSKKESPNQQSPEVATVLNNLARLYHDQDRFADAEPLYKRSLAIVEKVLGSNSRKALTRIQNLADLYHEEGRDEEAKPLYQRVAKMKSAAAS
jgi:tetratricopeptide (TPR) repeat protein